VNDLWNKRLKAAIAIIALLGLAGCGGGSGGGSATPDNAATISGSATVNTNTLVSATPTYSTINCGTPAAGQLMTCTVTGANLPLDLALSATGCANIQPVGDTASTTQRQFTCTPASQGTLQVSVSSVNVGSGATYAQNITIGQAACTLPQVLTNGVCAVPVATT
jgi:hypothetical protein